MKSCIFSCGKASIIFNGATSSNILSSFYKGFVLKQQIEPSVRVNIAEHRIAASYKNKVLKAETQDPHQANWYIYKQSDQQYLLEIKWPNVYNLSTMQLLFGTNTQNWHLYAPNIVQGYGLLPHPAGALLWQLAAHYTGQITMHGSGVFVPAVSKGVLFTGKSGIGKTTMAQLMQQAGSHIIDDDRLVIWQNGREIMMANLPGVKANQFMTTCLNSIYLLNQATENKLENVNGVVAFALVLANSIGHNFNSQLTQNRNAILNNLLNYASVNRFGFVNNASAAKFLIKHIKENANY